MTVGELYTRLCSIIKAKPENKNLEVKIFGDNGDEIELDKATVRVYADPDDASSFCGINLNSAEWPDLVEVGDNGNISKVNLNKIGRYFARYYLRPGAWKMLGFLSRIGQNTTDEEANEIVYSGTKKVCDEVIQLLKTYYQVKHPFLDDFQLYNVIHGAAQYLDENMRNEMIKIIKEESKNGN